MLKLLRHKKTAKRIWIALAVMVLPAFLFWGLGSAVRSRNDKPFSPKITGRNISPDQLQEAQEAVRNLAIMQFGDNFSQVQQYLDLESQAIDRILLQREAKKRGIKATDKEVIERVTSYPFFQIKGRFDNKTYNTAMEYYFRTLPRIFENQTRDNIIIGKLFEAVTNDAKLNDDEIMREYLRINQEVSVFYLAGLPADFAKDIKPSDEEVRDFFQKNSFEFREPPAFNVQYVSSDSEPQIQEAYQKLKKSADFQNSAKELGLEAKETGYFPDMGPVPGIGWSQDILNSVAALKTGEMSTPVKSDKFYILKLKDKKDASIPELDKVKELVKGRIIKDRSESIAKEKVDKAQSLLKELYAKAPASADLKKVARENGLKYDETKPFKFATYIEGIGASDTLWQSAQGLKEGEPSGVIPTPSGFYIIKLKEKSPLDEKKFAEDKEKLSKGLLARKKEETFGRFVAGLK